MTEPMKMDEPIYGVVLTDGQSIGITELKNSEEIFDCARRAIGCEWIEIVEPEALQKQGYVLLIDEEGKLKDESMFVNCIASYLYKSQEHGDAIIGKLLEQAGWKVKRGKHISLCAADGKRFMRLDTLGEEYSEQALHDVLVGKRPHTMQATRRMKKLSLLIDIQVKLEQGKGAGYEHWAKKFNIKQLGSSMAYLSAHKIDTYEMLNKKVTDATHHNDALLEKIKAAESRMKEIAARKKTIYDYMKTKDVFAEWKQSGWSKSFYAEHEQPLLLHKTAKKAFDNFGGRYPTVKELSAEYACLLELKQQSYADYRKAREEMRELLTVKANIDAVTQRKEDSHKKQEEQTR